MIEQDLEKIADSVRQTELELKSQKEALAALVKLLLLKKQLSNYEARDVDNYLFGYGTEFSEWCYEQGHLK